MDPNRNPSGPRPRLGEILLQLGLVDEAGVARALATQAGLPYLGAEDLDVAADLRALVPAALVRRLRCLPLRVLEDGAVLVAVDDPAGADRAAPLGIVLEAALHLAVTAHSALDRAIDRAWPRAEGAPAVPVPERPHAAPLVTSGAPPTPPPMPLTPLQSLAVSSGGISVIRTVTSDPGTPAPSATTPVSRPATSSPHQDVGAAAPVPRPGSPSQPSLRVVTDGFLGTTQSQASLRAIPAVGTAGLERLDLLEADLKGADSRLFGLSGTEAPGAILSALVAFALSQDALGFELVPDGARARLRLFAEGGWEVGPPLPRPVLDAVRPIDTPLPLRAPGARGRFLPDARRGRPWGGRVLFPPGPLPLERFGLLAGDLKRVRQWSVAREGILVVTGAPGSGRTTTLLSLATALVGGRSAAWIAQEPPPLPPGLVGIAMGEGGAPAALEAALRRDARVIFVDDIDPVDLTALAAAGSEGILVVIALSGINAADALATLREHVDDGWIGPQLLGVLELLSVRVLCGNCRTRGVTPKEAADALGVGADALPPVSWSEGPGCAACRHRGWMGRRVVANRIELTAGVPEGASPDEVGAELERGRAHRWVELAATLVAQGITSFAEVQRAMLDDDVAERQPRVSVATPGFRGGASEDTVDGAWAPVVDAASFAALDGQDVVEDLEIDSDLAPSPAGPPLLLVIDASSEAARRLDRAIPSGEIRLLTARTVDDGIALAARERPDALVLRALGDAAATAPRIRRFKEEAATRDLPILIVTKDDAGVREFLHRGASAVITAVMDGAQVRDILRSTVPVSAGPR